MNKKASTKKDRERRQKLREKKTKKIALRSTLKNVFKKQCCRRRLEYIKAHNLLLIFSIFLLFTPLSPDTLATKTRILLNNPLEIKPINQKGKSRQRENFLTSLSIFSSQNPSPSVFHIAAFTLLKSKILQFAVEKEVLTKLPLFGVKEANF